MENTTLVEIEDFFGDMFVFRWEVVVINAVVSSLMVLTTPLSLFIVKFEHEVSRTQTLLTRLDAGLVLMLVFTLTPIYFLDAFRYATGIPLPAPVCYVQVTQ